MDPKETREILAHFASQHRIEISSKCIVVKNINDFSRFVNSRRNKL
jgi:hypothetical protein